GGNRCISVNYQYAIYIKARASSLYAYREIISAARSNYLLALKANRETLSRKVASIHGDCIEGFRKVGCTFLKVTEVIAGRIVVSSLVRVGQPRRGTKGRLISFRNVNYDTYFIGRDRLDSVGRTTTIQVITRGQTRRRIVRSACSPNNVGPTSAIEIYFPLI